MTSAARPARRTVTVVLSGAGKYFQGTLCDRIRCQVLVKHPDGSLTVRRVRPGNKLGPAVDLARSEISYVLD